MPFALSAFLLALPGFLQRLSSDARLVLIGVAVGVALIIAILIFKFILGKAISAASGGPIEGARVEDVQPGAQVEIPWGGNPLRMSVEKVLLAKSGADRWTEVRGAAAGGPFRLLVESDRGTTKVYALAPKAGLDLHAIRATEESLKEIEQKNAGEVVLEGSVFTIDEAGDVQGNERGREREMPKAWKSWRFLSHDQTRAILVEKWFDEPYEVLLGEAVAPGDVRIYSMGG